MTMLLHFAHTNCTHICTLSETFLNCFEQPMELLSMNVVIWMCKSRVGFQRRYDDCIINLSLQFAAMLSE